MSGMVPAVHYYYLPSSGIAWSKQPGPGTPMNPTIAKNGSGPGRALAILFSAILAFILPEGCVVPQAALENPKHYTQDRSEYKSRYAIDWPAGEKPVRYGYHYVVSKAPSGYRVRVFHPDRKVLTSLESYGTAELNLLHGPCEGFWDDGSIRYQGTYLYGRRHGTWLECEPARGKSWSGIYQNDKKEGLWTRMDSTGLVESTQEWMDGRRHGKWMQFDSAGTKVNEVLYRNDTLVAELFARPRERVPAVRECLDGTVSNIAECTTRRMSTALLSAIRYPAVARENGIEGTAILQWDVLPDGSFSPLRVPAALCDAIEAECRRVFALMPPLVPGTLDGKPVRTTMTLPVKFSLR